MLISRKNNLIIQKKYIGSSKDIRERMYKYFDQKHLNKNNYMLIYRALLKYGRRWGLRLASGSEARGYAWLRLPLLILWRRH
jgi:hypothetical protein